MAQVSKKRKIGEITPASHRAETEASEMEKSPMYARDLDQEYANGTMTISPNFGFLVNSGVTAGIVDLPVELLVRIFKFLPVDHQALARCVCQRWKAVLSISDFFRDVTICNAATRGHRCTHHYVKIATNAETKRLTLSCTTKAALHELVSPSTMKSFWRCPLLEEITFINGKISQEALSYLPSSVKVVQLQDCAITSGSAKKLTRMIRGKVVIRTTSDLLKLKRGSFSAIAADGAAHHH
ncbi:F-box/LRR-repeat protein 12-like [Paramacrobiotus metropolitanus]|uniref:F-box/LRR-repeat protein 12-like n=1 Tax=Paramacrobiotus metropolitanus TaxID=2943436 RepID=UPI00244612BE|nr:F-box/LRR-repeat protein 12-like [Paramacrobiotus metropolitanus]